jgi:tRNA-specific 2-thiouridylase
MARVVVGMSGGVDSSLAAWLVKEAGDEVVGVTLKLWPCAEQDGGFTRPDACCSPTETIDARAVAVAGDIPHYVIDMEAQFRKGVVEGFIEGYGRGETPNPCVRCNETVKFGDLQDQARRLGADAVATGHYARVVERDGRLCPAVPADTDKDQTYFLFSLTQEQLRAARFPLGHLTKAQVRALAAERGLVTADKQESQDICFIGADGVEGFLRRELPEAFAPGPIMHVDGTVLGEHRGLAAYTVGQRKGLGVAWTEPLFVIDLDTDTNTVLLGPRSALLTERVRIRDCTWHLAPPPVEGLRVAMRNRHRMRPAPATVYPDDEDPKGSVIVYDDPIARPSPGQAAVAYDPELRLCLGGGWFR